MGKSVVAGTVDLAGADRSMSANSRDASAWARPLNLAGSVPIDATSPSRNDSDRIACFHHPRRARLEQPVPSEACNMPRLEVLRDQMIRRPAHGVALDSTPTGVAGREQPNNKSISDVMHSLERRVADIGYAPCSPGRYRIGRRMPGTCQRRKRSTAATRVCRTHQLRSRCSTVQAVSGGKAK